jgi:hypothetical protein
MANSIGWGAAVSNLIGYGKANEEGDNFKDESSAFLLGRILRYHMVGRYN